MRPLFLLLTLSAVQAAAVAGDRAVKTAIDDFGDPLPPAARARLGTVRWRHPGGSPRTLFVPHGTRVISYCDRGHLCVWDAATGKRRHFAATGSGIQALASCPRGKLLASGHDD